jgi:methylated-DNA-[protein]-cysteine S-methyltransferase
MAKRGRQTFHVDRLGHPRVPLWIVLDDDDALVSVVFAGAPRSLAVVLRHAQRQRAAVSVERRRDTPARRQLLEYLAGRRRRFDLRLRPQGTEFERAAWAALAEIPFGHTRSYAEQAQAIGRPQAVRAVGRANGQNPIAIVLPCHRVVGHDGALVGFGGGLPTKRWLLELERGRVPAWDPLTGEGEPRQLGLFG